MADSKCTRGESALMPRFDEEKHGDTSFDINKFCDELVEEILVRLPTKLAVQSKVVCKRWYSLISSPSFISHFIHMRHNRGIPLQSSIIFQFISVCDSTHHSYLQINSDGSLLHSLYRVHVHVFHLSYLPCPDKDVVLKGSSADLILCSYFNPTTKKTIYYVSNFLTRQWISLPPPPIDQDFMESASIGFLCSECKPVDNSSHHKLFMVVRLCSDRLSQFKVQLFFSQDFKWRSLVISSSLPLKPHGLNTTLVAYKGMLHWLNSANCIVVYDPLNTPNTLARIIHLPFQLPFFARGSTCFGVSQGRLRVVKVSNSNVLVPDPIMDVWEMEDYNSQGWNLIYKVHLMNLIHNGLPEIELSWCYLLSFHPENGDVIFSRIGNHVVLLNMKSKIIESFYPINKNAFYGSLNVFHLADQWWPTAVSSQH